MKICRQICAKYLSIPALLQFLQDCISDYLSSGNIIKTRCVYAIKLTNKLRVKYVSFSKFLFVLFV